MANTSAAVNPAKAAPAQQDEGARAPLPARQVHPEVRKQQLKDLLMVSVGLRFINSLLVRTFFQPDEYFQALEPAWKLAFGPDSGAWLTWEWEHQLRSSLHPVLFALWYRITREFMSYMSYFPEFQAVVAPAVPRVLQSLFAGVGDYYTWRLAEKMFGIDSNASWAALWMSILSPWQWYCSTRSFSNSLEASLTIMALYYWPWEMFSASEKTKEKLLDKWSAVNELRISLALAALAVVLRPTNLLIWFAIVTLGISRLTLEGKSPVSVQVLMILVRETVLCGGLVLAVSLTSDYLYYGEWTFPQYKWLYFNISQSLAVFYGRNPWHYYLVQGIPLLTTTFLPFVVIGLFRSLSPEASAPAQQSNSLKALSFSVLTTIATLSLVSHKEVRFIYPLLPILHVLGAPYAASFFTKLLPTPPANPYDSPTALTRKSLLSVIVAVNVLLAGYLTIFHQAAPINVTTFLRVEYERLHPDHLAFNTFFNATTLPADYHQRHIDAGEELFALFLTPCHSTPWRSHLAHAGLRARALTCEPPLLTEPGSAERAAYKDEADRFYARDAEGTYGVAFLEREMWPPAHKGLVGKLSEKRGGEVPRYIVGFEGVEDVLRRFFAEGAGKGMGVRPKRVWEGWNGLFNEDWRRQGRLVVWDTGVYPSEAPSERRLHEEL